MAGKSEARQSVKEELRGRMLERLRYSTRRLVLRALSDPDVVETFLNDDGLLWKEKFAKH